MTEEERKWKQLRIPTELAEYVDEFLGTKHAHTMGFKNHNDLATRLFIAYLINYCIQFQTECPERLKSRIEEMKKAYVYKL